MSGEVVQAATTAAVAAMGIIGTYLASRSTAREARRHERVERLYVELLESVIDTRDRAAFLVRGQTRPRRSESPKPPTFLEAELHLFVDRRVMAQFQAALQTQRDLLALLDLANHPDLLPDIPYTAEQYREKAAVVLSALEKQLSFLVDMMKRDLPIRSAVWRRRPFRIYGVKGRDGGSLMDVVDKARARQTTADDGSATGTT